MIAGAGLKLVETDEYSESGRGVYPDGLFRMLMHFHERYKHLNLPFIITENGVADETDLIRRPYMLEHLLALYAAMLKVWNLIFACLIFSFKVFSYNLLSCSANCQCQLCRVSVCLGICFGLFQITGSGLMVMVLNLDLLQLIVSMILHEFHAHRIICLQK